MYFSEKAKSAFARARAMLFMVAIIGVVAFAIGSCGYELDSGVGGGVYLGEEDEREEEEDEQEEYDRATININLIEERRGNTPGNIANLGYMAQSGEWLFYFMRTESENQLVKSHTNGGERQVLFSSPRVEETWRDLQRILYINALDGWVYFYYTGTANLYRIREDGSDIEVLAAIAGPVPSVQVVDDWIYFNDATSNISRMKLDGSEREVLLEKGIGRIQVTQGWIVYPSAQGFHKIRLDGTEQTFISDVPTSFFIADEGWMFFLKADDSMPLLSNIYKMLLDGSNVQRLSDNLTLPFSFVVSDGWVYYSRLHIDAIFTFYRIRIDGTDRQIIAEDTHAALISVTDDWIYFNRMGGYGASYNDYYRITIDGTERIWLFQE